MLYFFRIIFRYKKDFYIKYDIIFNVFCLIDKVNNLDFKKWKYNLVYFVLEVFC